MKQKTEVIEFIIKPFLTKCLLIAKSQKGLCAVLIGQDQKELKANLQELFSCAYLRLNEQLTPLLEEIVKHLKDPLANFYYSLDERGSQFQKKVWQALRQIPFGSTLSYTDLAIKLGSPTLRRAVAKACAANTLAIITPCHRVIRKDGRLCGYRWGINVKQQLLDQERLSLLPPLTKAF